jgi:hypothetical protein
MRADGNTVFTGNGNGAFHHRRITGMKSAGYISRADQWDDFFVQSKFIIPEAFSHIGVKVDFINRHNFTSKANLSVDSGSALGGTTDLSGYAHLGMPQIKGQYKRLS